MSDEEVKTPYNTKYKCPRCGCETWFVFGEEPNLMPMCTECGAFTWGEDQ